MTCAIAMTEPDAGSAATGLKTAAGDAYENKELDPLQVSMAKVFVAKTCTKICDTAVKLFGGYGYMEEFPVNHFLRRVRGTQIYGGTMQIHRNMIAGRILGRRNDQRKA